MKLIVTDAAVSWFRDEMHVKDGEGVRIFARYGGCGTVQSGFSLGIAKEHPREIGISATSSGILFFIETDDMWYLNDSDLTVDYDRAKDEIVFHV
ncbi:HesB/YadR/YfhF family protein [Fodinisporobacter ferrooxydans]|uniref:HesB/YadR/YfhF family protein n=1 Tax=Fodinisporobacter ferrooxydans TaxID=2901836 RepID=A0ABY4CNH0_9BACL|nr:HesB/YadR/YfhF family protein [Alicyclobacillaceae bacterium MYW30-H2]